MTRLQRSSARIRRAFTLVEVLAAAAILSFVVVVITHTVSAGQVQTYDAMHQERALLLAEGLMDEILRLPYADPSDASVTPGPEASETNRAAYDNMDDYHGYPKTPAIESSTSIRDFNGEAYPATYQGFTRTVTCQYTTQTVADLGGSIDGLLITVNVLDETNRLWTLRRFVLDEAESD